MRNLSLATLACILTFGSLAAQAQWKNCTGGANNNDCLGYSVISSGSNNSVFGNYSMASNTTGGYNMATGNWALYANTTGIGNAAAGAYALYSNTAGSANAALGDAALYSNTSGIDNTAAGSEALYSDTTGEFNTATGFGALYYNAAADYNTADGFQALYGNVYGSYNAAVGYQALYSTGEESGFNGYNTAMGSYGLYSTTTGDYNVGLGYSAGYTNATGSNNIAIGYEAGYSNATDANYNIDIGNEGNASDIGGVIRIGDSNQTAFYAPAAYALVSGGEPAYILSNGQLGYEASSIRFKKEVRSMGDVSNAIYRLRPVTYRYKQPEPDGSQPIEYGLIAEEVAKVYPDMVVRDAHGQIQTVEYQKLTPMMLNELQKEHRLLDAEQAKIEQLEKQLAALPGLEKRLTALEAVLPSSARLEARLTTK